MAENWSDSGYQFETIDALSNWTKFPENFGTSGQTNSARTLADILPLFETVPGYKNYINEIKPDKRVVFDTANVRVNIEDPVDNLGSMAAFFTSKFYKDYVSKATQARKYIIKWEDKDKNAKGIDVFYNKNIGGYQPSNSRLTVNDAESAGTAIINVMMQEFVDNGIDLMTAKSRVLYTDDGVREISNVYKDWIEDKQIATLWSPRRENVLKVMNVSVLNKPNHFRYQSEFEPNMVVSAILGSLVRSKESNGDPEKVNSRTMEVAVAKINKFSKIVPMNGIRFDKELVMELIENMNISGSFGSDDIKDILKSAKQGNNVRIWRKTHGMTTTFQRGNNQGSRPSAPGSSGSSEGSSGQGDGRNRIPSNASDEKESTKASDDVSRTIDRLAYIDPNAYFGPDGAFGEPRKF